MNLAELGWNDWFAERFTPHAAAGFRPARIIAEEKHRYLLHDGTAELSGELTGRLRHAAKRAGGFPAVGDWVAVLPHGEGRAAINAVLPRRACLTRKDPGERTVEQVIAANVDTVFVVAGLDRDFNPRRIERYLTAARPGGATPAIVLNKTDLCPDLVAALAQLAAVAGGVPVCPVSALADTGLEALRLYTRPGETVAFVGSSGVGKSTIINRLLGVDRQETGAVRASDDRGRHITTRRELIPLPGGGMLMDTPGLRQLQPWADEEALDTGFEDIAALARRCRFRDCGHGDEPGCAVRAALEAGELGSERLRSYEKLRRELRLLAGRQHRAKTKQREPRPPAAGA